MIITNIYNTGLHQIS